MDIDPLAFWAEHHKEYPILARMAHDTLSIPATGAGIERMFNYARDICHYRRGSLNESTVGNLMMYMCTSKFESEEEYLEFARETARISCLDVQMSDAFELESLISDDEDTFLLDNPDVDEDVDDDLQVDDSVFIQPSLTTDLPPIRVSSPDESDHELPDQEISMVRSSKRTRRSRDFYEGSI
jgi:hypothetical protein